MKTRLLMSQVPAAAETCDIVTDHVSADVMMAEDALTAVPAESCEILGVAGIGMIGTDCFW
jgi:hypothetical protein